MLGTKNILKWVSIKNGRNSCKMLNFSPFLGVNIRSGYFTLQSKQENQNDL